MMRPTWPSCGRRPPPTVPFDLQIRRPGVLRRLLPRGGDGRRRRRPAAAVVAVVWANSPVAVVRRPAPPGSRPLDLEHWAADGALTIFFYVAGLGSSASSLVGSLRRPADAAVPIVAALSPASPCRRWSTSPSTSPAAAGRRPRRLGDPRGDRHRVRAGRPRRGRARPADTAARLPADPRRRRRPGGHRRSSRSSTPPASTCSRCASRACSRRLRALQRAAGEPWRLRAAGARRLVVHARERRARDLAGVAMGLLTRVLPDDGEERARPSGSSTVLRPFSAGVAVPFFALMRAGVRLGGGGAGHRPGRRGSCSASWWASRGVLGGAWLATRLTRGRLGDDSAGATCSWSPCSPGSGSRWRCSSRTCRSGQRGRGQRGGAVLVRSRGTRPCSRRSC